MRPDVVAFGVTVCRGTLTRLDRAFAGFFARVRAGQTPGYPRFRSRSRFDSVEYPDTHGWRIHAEAGRLYLQGVGHVRLGLHRPWRGTPKTITVARRGRRYEVTMFCAEVPVQPLPATGRGVGIDLGVTSLLTTSDGRHVENRRPAQGASERLAEAQRALSRHRPGSVRRRALARRIGALHRRAANRRKDHAHQVSRRLVDDYDLIVHEDLRIAAMTKRPKPRKDPMDPEHWLPNGARAKSGLNRAISDSGWGQLLRYVTYKAEGAGREVIAVDPRYSSLECSCCGHTERANRVSQAEFSCRSCDYRAHADENAARVIYGRGLARRESAKSMSQPPASRG